MSHLNPKLDPKGCFVAQVVLSDTEVKTVFCFQGQMLTFAKEPLFETAQALHAFLKPLLYIHALPQVKIDPEILQAVAQLKYVPEVKHGLLMMLLAVTPDTYVPFSASEEETKELVEQLQSSPVH